MNKTFLKISLITLIIVILAFLTFVLFYINKFQRFDVISCTNDKISINSKTKGKITLLNTQNDSKVAKGQILAKINEEQYKQNYDLVNKKLEELLNSKKNQDEKTKETISKSNDAKQKFKTAKINLENANNDYTMYVNSYKDKIVTKTDLDNATKNLRIAQNQYSESQENYRKISENLKKEIEKQNSTNSEIEKTINELDNIELNLSYSTIISPIDGIIKEQKIKLDDEISKDDKLFVIVSNEHTLSLRPKENLKFEKNQKIKIKQNYFSKETDAAVQNIDNEKIEIKYISDDCIFKGKYAYIRY